MPQSIYQGPTYIGETVQAMRPAYNLLTANQASVETNLSGIQSVGAVPATVTREVSAAVHGSYGLKRVENSTNSWLSLVQFITGVGNSMLPATPGATYTFTAMVKSTSGNRQHSIAMTFADATDTQLGNAPLLYFTPTTTWQTYTITGVAPPTATQMLPQMYCTGTGAVGDTTMWDKFGVWEGDQGSWAMPGTEISLLGWKKIPVWNWIGGIWIQLNADIGPVDFTVRNITHDRGMIEIHNSQNYDHTGKYEVWLKTGAGAYVRRTDLDLADVPTPTSGWVTDVLATKWITGLAPSTTYTVRIRTGLVSGGYTPDRDVPFTTSANPLPLAVIDLRSPARTNTYTDLAWTKPAGSTATSYRVIWGRQGQGAAGNVSIPSASTYRVTGLHENTKYWYYVVGVNATGLVGPKSNQIQWATGWGEIRRQGSDDDLIWKPREWGSYRPDIEWEWARETGVKDRNPHIYQGYWPGSNWHGASNPSSNLAAGRSRRYWGTVVYDNDAFQEKVDAKHGSGSGAGLVITKLAFRRMYRHTNPGNIAAQDMVWHMTNSNPFNSGQPPTYDSYESSDMKAGEKIDYYRLDKTWGTKLVRGQDGGTKVNGLVLHRSDNHTNGYGAAGYGRWSGHMLKDPDTSGSWRYSDLSLMMEGSWNVLIRAYKGPYQW